MGDTLLAMKTTLPLFAMLLFCGLPCTPAISEGSQQVSSTSGSAFEFPSTSGNAFVRLCSVLEGGTKKLGDAEQSNECNAYAQGVVQGVATEVAYVKAVTGKAPVAPFCMPEEVENGQVVRITLKHIRNHPENAHLPTAPLIVESLRQAFPCHH